MCGRNIQQLDCPAGYFCPERTVNPITCGSVAMYCPLNSGVVKPCPDYQTSAAGTFTCKCKDTFLSTIDPFTNKLACTCAPGTTLENGVCVSCAAGFYKSSISLAACTNCNKFAIKGAVQSSQPASSPLSCICSKGDFRVLESPTTNSTQIGQCKPCPEGTLCEGAGTGVTIEDLPLQKGFWRSSFNSSNVVKCYIEEACSQSPSTKTVNSTDPIDDQKVDVDKTDDYNEIIFGTMLIIINSSGIGMILLSQLTKPIHYLFNSILGTHHHHEGTLRGMNEEQTTDQQGFAKHFLKVAKSGAEEGGWKLYVANTQKWGQFLDYSNATVERRCSTGNGAIDETRAVFVVKWDFEKLKSWVLNDSKDLRHGVVEIHEIGGGSATTSKNTKIEYSARKMKGELYSDRDYLLECVEGRGEDGSWYLVKRSVEDGELYSLKKSHSQGRVRAEVVYEGWVLHDLGWGEGMRVTYVENVDPGGLFKGIIVDKIMPKLLRDKIDDLLAHIDEENELELFAEFDESVEGVEMTDVANKIPRNDILGGGESAKNPIIGQSKQRRSKRSPSTPPPSSSSPTTTSSTPAQQTLDLRRPSTIPPTPVQAPKVLDFRSNSTTHEKQDDSD
ncbi:hypothetical protein TrVE_jg6068 [Triparma verrucosa]|uniref:START domain-containing protein n=1 Tax=Triparma verrucosa TaxID=1606542 RepID=A0A9W7F2E2_9STRA|nr:hypothetical protein TrVE_jg6068 [Triparma verrucosa]